MAVEEEDLCACYRRLESPLFNVLYRWLWQRGECEDVMHDAFLRIWDGRSRVDAQRLDALVWTTALNLARNRLRWKSLWRFGAIDPLASADDDPLHEADRHVAQRRLRAALDQLPRAQREVLLLGEFGGLDLAEIAALTGVPVGTVGSRRHSARARLHELLHEENSDA